MQQCTSRATSHSVTDPTAIVARLGYVRGGAPHRENLQFRIILRYQWRAGNISNKTSIIDLNSLIYITAQAVLRCHV
jgi:hypothetical protein